ncbi:hypothetical protein D3C83_308080 [compost metagenome]
MVVDKAVGPRRGRDGSTIRRNVQAGGIRLRSFKEQAIAQVSVFHRFTRQQGDQGIFVLPLEICT